MQKGFFMNTTESLGYLKGLLDGLDFDADKKDTKMFKAIVEVLENIIQDIDDVNEDMDLLAGRWMVLTMTLPR